MKKFNLNDMVGGWFVGDFEPSAFKTENFEVAIKKYKKNDYEKKHVHYKADELTVIVTGKVKMNGIEYSSNDIIYINAGEPTDFEVLSEEVITVVVKTKSIKNDKFII